MPGQRLLLHVCCAPCAVAVVPELRAKGFEVTALFYNPNIHPLAEYLRRREALATLAAATDLPTLWLDDPDAPLTFLRAVAGREAERCQWCLGARLEKTAGLAGERGFDAFSSTLLYSRYQPHDLIRELGQHLGCTDGPAFYHEDFRRLWSDGVRLSKDMGLYRQPYCGCIFSEYERYAKELRKSMERTGTAVESRVNR